MAMIFAFQPTNRVILSLRERAARDQEAKRLETLKAPPNLNFATKAVAAPPLSRGQWERLFAQMSRKGLDTVYVPVFWDGQTLFPSEHFPLLPLCRGEDLLADALALAKPRKIHVIAVVNTLAWRLPASEVHYLSSRPELVDVDASGRSRRDWGRQNLLTADSLSMGSDDAGTRIFDPLSVSDFVRPTAPEVRSRLLGLVRELRHYKGLDGVALARWTRFAGADSSEELTGYEMPPMLGYTLPERIAFLSDKGVDPVDTCPAWSAVGENGCDQTDYLAIWSRRQYKQDSDLASALLRELEAGWPGRTQVFSTFKPSEDFRLPDAHIVIGTDAAAPQGGAAYLQLAPPSTTPPEPAMVAGDPPEELPNLKPGEAYHKRLDYFHAVLCGVDPLKTMESSDDETKGLPAAKGIVLDFTGSPDLLWDGLALLPNR